MQRSVNLIAFSPCTAYQIATQVKKHNQQLTLNYDLFGDITALSLAKPSRAKQRRDLLWQHSCFECFIAEKAKKEYYEYNLSSSGHWNAYRFSDYRQGMSAADVSAPVINIVEHSDRHFQLQVTIALPKNLQASCDIAISVILKHKPDNFSYWAVQHSSAQADFHQRQDFVIAL